MLRFEELAAGLVLTGEVRNVHEYGVFVRLEVTHPTSLTLHP